MTITKIYPIMSNSYGSNCYLISGKRTVLIDSGVNPEGILQKINELNIGIDYLINTHCHYDHIGGNLSILKILNEIPGKIHTRILVHELDAHAMETGDDRMILASSFGTKCPKMHVDMKLNDKDNIYLGDIELKVIHTPGHTRGGICLYEPESKSLFSGDTVFAEGIGRTDFPGGNWSDLDESIQKILKLNDAQGITTLYPGHGRIGSGDDIKQVYGMYF